MTRVPESWTFFQRCAEALENLDGLMATVRNFAAQDKVCHELPGFVMRDIHREVVRFQHNMEMLHHDLRWRTPINREKGAR